jgi:hypothetical protein
MPELKPRPCCGDVTCPRSEIVRLLAPDDPIENDVDTLAGAVARRCLGLGKSDLEYCFTRTFEIPAECSLFDRFCTAYESESVSTLRSLAAQAGGNGAGQ